VAKEHVQNASRDPNAASTDAQTQPKRRRIIVILLAVVIVLVLLVPVTNLFIKPVTGTELTQATVTHPEFQVAALVLEANCMDCHSADTKLPFYAQFPIARSIIQEDIDTGKRYMDMTVDLAPARDRSYNEAAIAKLEYVLINDTMPPTPYVLLHWNHALSNGETKAILDAIHTIREQHFVTAGVAPAFADDVLQPLPESVPVDEQKAALGEKLYHDVRLSGDNTISCASCHGLNTGGCDRQPVSTGVGGAKGPINAPTVYNAVFNLAQFWDGRAADLAEQAAGPVNNPKEMGSNWPQVIGKLQQDSPFVAAFAAAYLDGLSSDTITHAIAEFEKTLVTPDSTFDRYLKGDANALNETELAGLRLFRENACANCHVGKAMGGQSYELMGRAADYFADRGHPTDADLGRIHVTNNETDKHKFKVPTLRNIALTYPYFHDASQKTLKGAVMTMAKYQGYREFTDAEADQVVAFLQTLTGKYKGKLLE
jgi:cytochrome c peroxidase